MPEVEIITTEDRAIVEARISGLNRKQVAERHGVSVAVVRAAEKRLPPTQAIWIANAQSWANNYRASRTRFMAVR